MVLLNNKAQAIISLAKSCLGWPYVYAASGEFCTPTNRKRRNRSDHPTIISKCQVLRSNNKKDTCEGCPYEGCRMFDCRGFTYWVLQQIGITISGVGATTQYNTAKDWVQRGEIAEMPNVVCCVFIKKGSKMSHTGLHIGDGIVIDCSTDVSSMTIKQGGFTHYAIPKDLYTSQELSQASEVKIMDNLKRGSRGHDVEIIQQQLNELGYDCGAADGIFGAKTDAAVRRFQADNNLTIDGVVGPTTRRLLDGKTAKPDIPPGDNPLPIPSEPTDNNDDVIIDPPQTEITVPREELQKIRDQLKAILDIIDQWLNT